MHRPSGQRRLEALELVAQIRGNDVVVLLLDQVRDDLRGRPRHRFRPLVGQGLRGNLPGEDVLDHQAVLVPPSRVLAEVHQVRLQPVVGPLRRALPQTPRLGRQHLPGHVAAQGFHPLLQALTGRGILGNFSVIEVEADCWSKAQSDSRYPLVATFNSLGSTVTSIDGRVTALENSPLPADISCTSLTASSFVETPELRGTPIVLRAIDNTLLASFAAAGITLDQDVTVNAARTLNATTADFAQLLAGSVAASGNVTTNGSILADQQMESDLRLRAPLLESDPAGFFLTLRGGTQGVLVDDTFRVNGAIACEASLPFLSLSGGTSGVQVLSPLLVGPPGGTVGTVIRNVAPTGESTVLLDSNNQAGLAELKVLSIGGCQLNAPDQTIALNTSSGPANLLIEANTGGGSDGEVICFYGFQNLSDESLKTNLRPVLAEEAQQCFDGVEATFYDRVDGPANQVGFVAQQVEASGTLGKSLCKLKKFEDRELMTLDYQRMTAVLWQVCKGRPEEQAADELGRELLLDEVEEAVALGHRGVPSKVPRVERRKLLLLRYRPSASALV